MIQKLLDAAVNWVGLAAQRAPGASGFAGEVPLNGKAAPVAGVDIVAARCQQVAAAGMPSFVSSDIDRPEMTLEEIDTTVQSIIESFEDQRPGLVAESSGMAPIKRVVMAFTTLIDQEFAWGIQQLTGWPVIALGRKGEEVVRFLNRHPSGRLLDATGFVTLERLRHDLQDRDLMILGPADINETDDDQTMVLVMAAVAHLDVEPFIDLRSDAQLWVRRGTLQPWLP